MTSELEFILVETVEDVIKETIGLELPKPMMLDMDASSLTGGAGFNYSSSINMRVSLIGPLKVNI